MTDANGDDSIPEIPNLDDMDEDERNRRTATDEVHSELVRFLTESREMRQTAQSAVRQSLWAAGGALAGSLLLGPAGGLAGGVAGSLVGYLRSDTYDGVVLAVVKLQGSHRDRVVREVTDVLITAGATARQLERAGAFQEALRQFAGREEVRDGLWKACMVSVGQGESR